MFGSALRAVVAYAELLAGPGIERGLVGPREVERLWERHLYNCAALVPLLPPRGRVADIGSGAGLPGVVLALCRPDLDVVLIDAQLRRTRFLEEVVAALCLDNVSVKRGRAQELAQELAQDPGSDPWRFDVVTARAVAPLDRLLGLALPLLRPGGTLLALKGDQAAREVTEAAAALAAADARAEVLDVPIGVPHLAGPTATVVRVLLESPERDHRA